MRSADFSNWLSSFSGQLSDLEQAACDLIDSLPQAYQDSFAVLDFGFYLHNRLMDQGVEDIWPEVIQAADAISPYYLLLGRVPGREGEVKVEVKMPKTNQFDCLQTEFANYENNLERYIQVKINYEPINLVENIISSFNKAAKRIREIIVCCQNLKSSQECSSCIFSAIEYDRVLSSEGLFGIQVDELIENGTQITEESVGYSFVTSNLTINIDETLGDLKQDIFQKFPDITVKIYPINYTESCSNYSDTKEKFLSDDVDIGILIGVIGDFNVNTIRWKMISNADLTDPEPISYNSDTCYYFDEDDSYIKKEYCDDGIVRPRGIIGFPSAYTYNFIFADPVMHPRCLTDGMVFDTDGENLEYGDSKEPLLNKYLNLTKDDIWKLLATPVKDVNGEDQLTAFDYHFFAPWSLYVGSGGFSAPFDYSAKGFFLDRLNYIFISDDGDNIVGHNYRNMGNFLWGASTYILGVPKWIALLGAHGQNLFGEFGDGTIDDPDDQYSIKLGRLYAKKRNWHTIYGGKKNIFRK